MPRPAQKVDTSTFVGQIAAEIRRRRLKKFDRAEDAAIAAGIEPKTWFNWETGRHLPLSALPIVAKALGCSPRQLLPA
jgi:hypothetical protein